MITLHIITLGKLKESYWREAEAEYIKRLSPWAAVEIRELKEESFNEKDPADFIKQKEGEKILAELEKYPDSFVVALDEGGKTFSSTALAKEIERHIPHHHSFVFIVGGPLGLHETIQKKANVTLSLSPLTFTHQMARVILVEQLYRSFMISSGRRYHY